MDKAEFEHADPFELWKIILAQRAVRDVNEKRIAVLTQTLMQLLNSEHCWDEFPCPNERGVCTCGLVERNALIRHVLDPSQDLAFYQQDEAHSAARISYEAAWADLQNALLIISRENEKGRTSFQFLEDRARAREHSAGAQPLAARRDLRQLRQVGTGARRGALRNLLAGDQVRGWPQGERCFVLRPVFIGNYKQKLGLDG